MKRTFLYLCAAFCCFLLPLQALDVEKTWQDACCHMEQGKWGHALLSMQTLETVCPLDFKDGEFQYYLGLCYYNCSQLIRANQAFDRYLACASIPEHFEETLQFKFVIANLWSRRAYSDQLLQRLNAGCRGYYENAEIIYDQIASLLPNEEIAAYAVYNKGCMQMNTEHYKEALESFHSVIRCYDVPELEVCAYFGIAQVYYRECQSESNDPDLLPLAMLNIKSFQKHFPQDHRSTYLHWLYNQMEETFACHMVEMAHFYAKQDHPCAAKMYYQYVIEHFPTTKAAEESRMSLCRRKL